MKKMILMYITNDINMSLTAESCGVDWIFIDLEIKGKEDRQGHLDTVISRHNINDIRKVKNVLTKSKLVVRINPIHDKSSTEINKVINSGADIIMLPYFKSYDEVRFFLKNVNKRVETCLLLETSEAVDNLDEILKLNDIDYIHIGLNDLHLSYRLNFMFELLSNGTVEAIISKIKKTNITYGFGGIAKLSDGMIPSEFIIAEHKRLGSTMSILSRTFYNQLNEVLTKNSANKFKEEVKKIRAYEKELEDEPNDFFIMNKYKINLLVDEILRIK